MDWDDPLIKKARAFFIEHIAPCMYAPNELRTVNELAMIRQIAELLRKGDEEERRRIVEWLRESRNDPSNRLTIADAIERGDHLERTDGK